MGPEKIVAVMAGVGGLDVAALLDHTLRDQLIPQPAPDEPTDLRTTEHGTGLNPNHRNIRQHTVRIYHSENGRPLGAIAQKLPLEADFSNPAVQHQAAKNLFAVRKAETGPTDAPLTRRQIREAARRAVRQIAKSQKEARRAATQEPSR